MVLLSAHLRRQTAHLFFVNHFFNQDKWIWVSQRKSFQIDSSILNWVSLEFGFFIDCADYFYEWDCCLYTTILGIF